MGSLKALILITDGVSCTELIPQIDVLRKANFFVTVAGVDGPRPVTSDSNITISPDLSLEEAVQKGPFDVVILPGGESAADIMAHSKLCAVLLATHVAEKKVIAALGAGCLAAMRLGAGKGKKIAVSPHLAQKMKALNVDKEWNLIESEPVVIDGYLVTCQGSLFAMDFAFDLLQKLIGKKLADEVAENLQHKRHCRKRFSK